MNFEKITEKDSHYDALEQKTVSELLSGIHQEDQNAVAAVGKVLPQVEQLIIKVVKQLQNGGRLFYIGAGTSGRLGVLDASECPPTFGVNHNMVIGIMAGGDKAIRKAVEFAEDNFDLGWKDLQEYRINSNDIVIGIAASGSTPYVIGALKKCQTENITTSCIVCNVNSYKN